MWQFKLNLDSVKLHRHNTVMKRNYHHGDLANTLVESAVSLIQSKGLAKLSLREVARAAGVSHAAPAHHFGDKAGLLTAVAIAGFALLERTLNHSLASASQTAEAQLINTGAAYIRFALSHPAYFEVMFRPELINDQSTAYALAAQAPRKILKQCIREFFFAKSPGHRVSDHQVEVTVIALWSQVHGFASLWLNGNFGDPADLKLLDKILLDMLSSITLSL